MREFGTFLTHSRIVACVSDLLGEDVIGWGSHFFCKLPETARVLIGTRTAAIGP